MDDISGVKGGVWDDVEGGVGDSVEGGVSNSDRRVSNGVIGGVVSSWIGIITHTNFVLL